MTDLPQPPAYVFISYSRKQLDYAKRLANFLKSRGFSCWFDKIDIEPGEVWRQEIEDGVTGCAAFVVLVTPDAQKSEWVNKEVGFAKQGGKKIFPLLLSGSEWPLLSDIQYLDVQNGKMPDAAFLELLGKTAPAGEIGKDITPFIFERGNAAYVKAETAVAPTKKGRAWRNVIVTIAFLVLAIVMLLAASSAPAASVISFFAFLGAIKGIYDLLTNDLPSGIRQIRREYAFDTNSQIVNGETISSEETLKDSGIPGTKLLREYNFHIVYRFVSPISGNEITDERSETTGRTRAEEMPVPGTPIRVLFNADNKYRLL